jgi:hypothetical protein
MSRRRSPAVYVFLGMMLIGISIAVTNRIGGLMFWAGVLGVIAGFLFALSFYFYPKRN